jgi:hypothetical protein
MTARTRRPKLSTTIAPENQAFLKSLVKRGKAANLADAIDRTVSAARRAEARRKLAAASEVYYASLSGDALREEQELEKALSNATSQVDFDAE